jgi:hypothetical protein
MRKPIHHPRHHAALIAVVLMALVLMQALGLLHRVAHAAPADVGATWSQAATPDHGPGDWLQALFKAHDSASSCEVYDQLTHADPLGSACAPATAVLPEPGGASVFAVTHIAAQASGFLARGPPLLS